MATWPDIISNTAKAAPAITCEAMYHLNSFFIKVS
jgi:hypothetical protein